PCPGSTTTVLPLTEPAADAGGTSHIRLKPSATVVTAARLIRPERIKKDTDGKALARVETSPPVLRYRLWVRYAAAARSWTPEASGQKWPAEVEWPGEPHG